MIYYSNEYTVLLPDHAKFQSATNILSYNVFNMNTLFKFKVWKHYKDNTIEMIVDRSIYEDNIRDEVMHILQIGLLCTQANSDDRPTMGKVVELLRNHRNDLEIVLSDPPFLNVEPVENMQEGEHSRLLSTNSAPSLSGSSRSYLSGR